MRRVSTEGTRSRSFSLPPPKNFFIDPTEDGMPAIRNPGESVEGVYRGYLHHEATNVFQKGELDVTLFQMGGTGIDAGLRFSSVARLYFGNEPSETLAYRFNDRHYPSPLFQPQFVLKRPEKGLDAILRITGLGNGFVKGIWYSQHVGRVGTFLFSKASVTLPAGSVMMEAVRGRYFDRYLGYTWDLNVQTFLDQVDLNTQNPFYPINFAGFLWEKHWQFPKTPLRGGTYDFYTGRISLNLEEGKGILVGERTSQNTLSLKWLLDRHGIPMEKHVLRTFVRR